MPDHMPDQMSGERASGFPGDGPFTHHLDRFVEFDARVDELVDSIRTPALDHVCYALSSAADHSLMWHVIGGLQSVRKGSLAPARRLSKILGIESAVTNGLVAGRAIASEQRLDEPVGDRTLDAEDLRQPARGRE